MTATAEQRAADPAAGLTVQSLWPHQVAAFRAVRDRRACLIDGDMGVGKSLVSIALLEHDLRAPSRYAGAVFRPYRALVLAPKSVLGVWPDQVAQHAASGWTVWNGEVRGRHGKALRNPSVARRAEAEGLRIAVWSPTRLRVVTHLDASAADVDQAATILRRVLAVN